MPELDGLEATRRILAADPAARILILTTFDLDEYVYEALRAGASGFVLKDDPPGAADRRDPHRRRRRRAALTGDHEARDREVRRACRARPPPKELDELSERERDVFRLMAQRPLERGDRQGALHQRDDREDARHAHPPEAQPARPRPGGRARLPDGPVRSERRVTARRRPPFAKTVPAHEDYDRVAGDDRAPEVPGRRDRARSRGRADLAT